MGPRSPGRRCSARHRRDGQVYGERHPQAKLTEQDVRELRALLKEYPGTEVRQFARPLGVSESALSMAISGRTWSHLPGAIMREDEARYIHPRPRRIRR